MSSRGELTSEDDWPKRPSARESTEHALSAMELKYLQYWYDFWIEQATNPTNLRIFQESPPTVSD